jgi:hypothetical protein
MVWTLQRDSLVYKQRIHYIPLCIDLKHLAQESWCDGGCLFFLFVHFGLEFSHLNERVT